MIKKVFRFIRLEVFKKIFRLNNSQNKVHVQSYFPIECVSVGKYTYGPLDIVWMAPKDARVKIGSYCSIGPKVTFLVGGGNIITKEFQLGPFRRWYITNVLMEILIEIL